MSLVPLPVTCPVLAWPAHGAYQAGQGPVPQGGLLVGQVGQQPCVALGCAADEGLAVGFPHLCQSVGRLGGCQEGGKLGGLRVTEVSLGSMLSPRGWALGGEGHSFVEEQQVGGVELKVALEALPGGQVGQTAELGRAGSVSLPCPAGGLPSPFPSAHLRAPHLPLSPCPHVHPSPPSACWLSVPGLHVFLFLPQPPQREPASEQVKPSLRAPSPLASGPCPPQPPLHHIGSLRICSSNAPLPGRLVPLTWPTLGLFQIYY